jgi:hypothetical protein
MKKRKLISILVSAGVVASLMFAMTGPVHAWTWAEANIDITSGTGIPTGGWDASGGEVPSNTYSMDWKAVSKYAYDEDDGIDVPPGFSGTYRVWDSPGEDDIEAIVHVNGQAYSGGHAAADGYAAADYRYDFAKNDNHATAIGDGSNALATGEAYAESGEEAQSGEWSYQSWADFGYWGSEATAWSYADAELDSDATADVFAKAINGGDANSVADANAFDGGTATAESTSLADMTPTDGGDMDYWMWSLNADALSDADASHGGTATATSTADSIGNADDAWAESNATADGEGSNASALTEAYAKDQMGEGYFGSYRSDALAYADAMATLDSDADAQAYASGVDGGDAEADANAEADKYSQATAQADADATGPGMGEPTTGTDIVAGATANAIADLYSCALADAGAVSVMGGAGYAMADADADVGSEAKSEAYANADGEYSVSNANAWSTADKYSDAYAEADADSLFGGYADALAVAIADEESMATDSTLVLVPRIVTVPLLDDEGEPILDENDEPVMHDIVVYDYALVEEDVYAAKAIADVESSSYEGYAGGGAFAQAQFDSTADAELTVTNWLGGYYAYGWSEAESDFDSTATSIVDVLNEGGYWSEGEAIADAQLNSTATAVTKVSNYYGSSAWGSTEAKANFDSSAIGYVIVEEGMSMNFSSGGSATANADYGSTAVAAGKSSTLQSEASEDYAGHEAYGSANADAIFESTALAYYEAESINDAGAKAYADSTAICGSTALSQVIARADGFGFDGPNAARADGTALAVEDANATAIAFAEAANDLPDVQQPGGLLAVANANAVAAAGGTAFSLSMSDATSLDLVPEGFESGTNSVADFDTGGAAWAWGIATDDQVFTGTVTVAVLGTTSTAVSLADTGMELGVPGEPGTPAVYLYAEVEPAP